MAERLKSFLFWSKYLLKSHNIASFLKKMGSNHDLQLESQNHQTLDGQLVELKRATLMFHVEEVLLKSSSLLPYYMLVAFEAGSLIRALLLFLAYPFVFLFSKEVGLKIMVFMCFFGLKKDNFRIATTVLPKFFMEDVGYEGYKTIMMYEKKVALTDFPTIMIEGFLKDYLGVDAIIGKELKEAFGYFVGFMVKERSDFAVHEIVSRQGKMKPPLVGFTVINSPNQHVFEHCKEVLLVNAADKKKWQILPKDKYPQPLIFHDGRLAFMPTFFATLAMIIWLPYASLIMILRIAGMWLPYQLSASFLSLTGLRCRCYHSKVASFSRKHANSGGTLYVSNHRTLFDPIYVSFSLMKPVTAVTYSISKVSELFSPIKTARLRRERGKDSKIIRKILLTSDVVICPEGTTCREPYLLRFSPLFAELSDDIVPVAIEEHMSMFYGTTASGHKFLDPVFFLLNPYSIYHVQFLEKLPKAFTSSSSVISKTEVANFVQAEIAKVLGFKCTNLTRKDKYMILSGNEGK